MGFMEQIRIAFASIPSYMYPHLITAVIIGIAVGLIFGLTFVYSILFMPMQRRLKREVVNIQMDNEKLKKDFSHYKRRARRKLKYYRDLELRSIRPDIYGDVDEILTNPEDSVDQVIDRTKSAVDSLPPEPKQVKEKKGDRYARAARDEPISVPEQRGDATDNQQVVHEVQLDDVESVESVRRPNAPLQPSSHHSLVLEDLTDLALEADVAKKTKSVRRGKGKPSFLENLRSKQESLAKQFTATDEFGTTEMTQTIEMPLQDDDVDNWQDFENEFGKELSDTSNALDISTSDSVELDEKGLAELRIDDTDIEEKSRSRGAPRKKNRKSREKGQRSRSRVTVVDETIETSEPAVKPPRITSRKKERKKERKAQRKKKKDSPVDGFMSALRQRRDEMDASDDDYDSDEREAS